MINWNHKNINIGGDKMAFVPVEDKLNKEKFKAVLSYIINRCENKPNVGKTLICKLLYFSDFNHYEIYEKSITDETYLKYEHGPFPSRINEILDEMIDEGSVEMRLEPYYTNTQNHYYLNNVPDLSLLNTDELRVINSVIDKISDWNARKASNYSHGDLPWKIAEDNDELDYEYVFYRDPEYSVRDYGGEL